LKTTSPALPDHVQIDLPDWVRDAWKRMPAALPAPEDRMAAILTLARENFRRDTGGPFAAGVFERATGRPVAVGVNRVVPDRCSSAHAEIVALSLAQRVLGSYDLGGAGLPEHELVVNWRPCAMCFGGILWSGVRSLVIAGDGPELEQLTGFDEGPIHPEWRAELGRRGIAFQSGIRRDEAVALFREFAASGRAVYNGRSGRPAENRK
jgi:tRNA(Arg) A34 adenosine deaminase TadA